MNKNKKSCYNEKKEVFEEQKALKSIFKKYIISNYRKIILLFLLILFGVAIGNLTPLIYGKIIDVLGQKTTNKIPELIAMYLSVVGLSSVLGYVEKYYGEIISLQMTNKIRCDLFECIIHAKAGVYSTFTLGEYISRLNDDSDRIVAFFLDIFTSAGQVAINFIVSVAYILHISTRLSFIAAFYIPASFFVMVLTRKYYKKNVYKQKDFSDKYMSFLGQVLANNEGIKSFQLEQWSSKYNKFFLDKKIMLSKKYITLSNFVSFFTQVLSLISFVYIIFMSSILIKSGSLTVGDMIAFNTYINLTYSSVATIWNFNFSKQEVLVAAKRMHELFNLDIESSKPNMDAQDMSPIMSIGIDNLSFRYGNNERNVFNHLNLKIEGPGIYAIVGRNGTGKSTIAKLLMRFYEAEHGEIKYNDLNIESYDIYNLRKAITYIAKDDVFFKGTIYENLLLANPNASRSDIYNICMSVGIHDYILSLPNQYETVLDENGSNLSSGEKQKLSIVRSLLRKSQIMILDEITANLDGQIEKDVLNILDSLKKDIIIIMISHKISTVAVSDHIFVLDYGKVSAEGTHIDLMKKSSVYKNLFGTSNV